MLYANVGGVKSLPTPKTVGTCPGCDAEVIAKCGEIKVWHWAHRSLTECDAWWENEGEWHRTWKTEAGGNDPSRIEVTIKDLESGKWHRADAMTPDGWVVELQHSPISRAEMLQREAFYGRHAKGMVWIFDHTHKVFSRDHRIEDAEAIVFIHQIDGWVSLMAKTTYSKKVIRRYLREDLISLLNTEGMSAIEDLIADQMEAEKRAQRERDEKRRQLEIQWELEKILGEDKKDTGWLDYSTNSKGSRYEHSLAAYQTRMAKKNPPPFDEDSIFRIFEPENADIEVDDDILWGVYTPSDDIYEHDEEDIGILARAAADRVR